MKKYFKGILILCLIFTVTLVSAKKKQKAVGFKWQHIEKGLSAADLQARFLSFFINKILDLKEVDIYKLIITFLPSIFNVIQKNFCGKRTASNLRACKHSQEIWSIRLFLPGFS